MSSEFVPTFEQPVTLESLRRDDSITLTDALSALVNSIRRLEESNDYLLLELTEDIDLDTADKVEFNLSIQENRVTIARQLERIEMIRIILQEKLGVEATNSHYTIATTSLSNNLAASTTAADDSINESNQMEEDDGMYL